MTAEAWGRENNRRRQKRKTNYPPTKVVNSFTRERGKEKKTFKMQLLLQPNLLSSQSVLNVKQNSNIKKMG